MKERQKMTNMRISKAIVTLELKRYALKYIETMLFALILIFLAGCASVPSGKFQTLERAGADILTDTTLTFSKIEELQRHFEIIVAPDLPLRASSFEPAVIGGKSTDIVPELRFRESAVRTLVKYLAVLEAFSAKDYESAIDSASVELAASVKNLDVSSGAVSAKESKKSSGMFATVADVMGREVVREKRVKALRRVMQSAQTSVESLADLISRDNDKISQDIDIMLERIIAHANAVRPPFGTTARMEFDQSIAVEISDAKVMRESLKSVSTAILQIPVAHRELKNYLERKSSTSDGLSALTAEAERANLFYGKLK